MRSRVNKLLGFKTPPDGLTPEERQIQKLIANTVVEDIYGHLPTSRMVAIVALHFELGYTQEMLSHIFGVKPASIAEEIGTIRRYLLQRKYQVHKNIPLKGSKGKIGLVKEVEVDVLL